MALSSKYAPPRAPYDGLREAFEALMRKKDASLSGGAYARDPRPGVSSIVHGPNRSRFAWARDGAEPGDGKLGMGIVQAILAALTGAVRAISWDPDGRLGRVTVDGIGSGETYQMSWDDQRPDYLLLGGFVNGATYQAAIVGLALLWTRREINPARTEEVLQRWWALVRLMETHFVHADRTSGWDGSQVKAACQDIPKNAAIRDAIEALADALQFALRYALPELAERGLYVQYEPCVSGGAGTRASAAGSVLLILPDDPMAKVPPRAEPEATGSPTEPAPTDTGDGEDDDLDLDRTPGPEDMVPGAEPEASDPAVASETAETLPTPPREPAKRGEPSSLETPSAAKRTRRTTPKGDKPTSEPKPNTSMPPASTPPVKDVPLIGNGVQARIARAFAREGDVFLYGVTATGKTTWAKQAAIANGYGLEIVVLKPGVKDDVLYGTSVQDLSGRWIWQDGPIVRAARRATAGERIVLLLDELPRGDKSVVAGTMDLMNLYSGADLLAQRLSSPADAGPYRVVRVFDTQETLVFPAARLKIVATANLGDKYQGLDLNDPAFRRRWTGAWLELAGYDASDTASILAGHLAIPATHALIKAMIEVDRDIHALQRKDEALVMTTNLATLIVWGKEVIRLTGERDTPRIGGRPDIKGVFLVAAQDLWIDMICPLAGDCRDPEVYRELLMIVQRHAPGVL